MFSLVSCLPFAQLTLTASRTLHPESPRHACAASRTLHPESPASPRKVSNSAAGSSAGLAVADMRLLAKAGYSDSLTAGCIIARPGYA